MIALGAQLYTVRAFTQTPEDIERTRRKIKEIGFNTIQISGFGYIEPQRLADLVRELELDVCVTHTPFDRLQNDLDAVIQEHRLIGCDTIGLGAMPAQYQSSKEGAQQFIADIRPIADHIREEGLTFAYHNHNFEFQRYDGRLVMDMLIEDTDPDAFHFILDTFWLQMGGVNPPDYIRKVAGRMKVCHFKDFAVDHMKPIFSEIGLGNLDLKECFRACEDAGVKAIVIEEDECPRDPFDCLAVSLRNLKAIAANH